MKGMLERWGHLQESVVGSTKPPAALSSSSSSRLPLKRQVWATGQLPMPTLESLASSWSSSSKDAPGYPTSSRIQTPHAFSGWEKGPFLHVAPNRQQTPPPSSPPTSQNAPRRKLYWHLTVLPNLTSLNPTRLLVGAGLGPRPPSGHSALLFPRPTCHEGTHFIPRASLPSLPHWTFASSRWSPLLWFTPQGVKMPPEERY